VSFCRWAFLLSASLIARVYIWPAGKFNSRGAENRSFKFSKTLPYLFLGHPGVRTRLSIFIYQRSYGQTLPAPPSILFFLLREKLPPKVGQLGHSRGPQPVCGTSDSGDVDEQIVLNVAGSWNAGILPLKKPSSARCSKPWRKRKRFHSSPHSRNTALS